MFGKLGAFCLAFLLCSSWACADVTLRLTTWDGDKALQTIREIAAAFEQTHPGIHVSVEPIGYSDYQSKILAQVAANIAPDVIMMDPPNFQRYARRGVLADMDQLIASDPGFDLKQYYKPIVDSCSFEGRLYLLPRDIAPIGLCYYNKRLFDQAHIPYPDGSWTWDFKPRPELREKDFLWVVQQLTQHDAKGKVTCYGFSPGWPQAFADLAAFSQGARLLDNPENPQKVQLGDPRFVSSYQLMQDLFYKYKWAPSPTEMSSSLLMGPADLFVQQRLALFQSGIWEVPGLRTKIVPGQPLFFDWDVCLMPAFRDGTRAMPTGGSGYAIAKQTLHLKEAWELTKWLAGDPGMIAMAKAGIAQPAIARLAQQEPWVPGPNTPVDQQYPHNRIATHDAVPSVIFEPTADFYPELKMVMAPELDRIWTGTASAKSALAAAQKAGEEKLAQLREGRSLGDFPWVPAIAVGLLLFGGLVAWIFAPEWKVKRTAKQRHEARAGYVFLMPWLIGMVAFTLGPMLLSLMMSFAEWDIITPAKWRGMENYHEAFAGDPRFYASLKVTGIYTLVSVPLGIALALGLALLLNVKVRGIAIFRMLFYLPALTSGVAIALIWKAVFKADGGLLNAILYGTNGEGNFMGIPAMLAPLSPDKGPINWLGNEHTALSAMILMSVWGAGAGMVVLLAGLQGIPEFYYEAAKLDGAGSWRRFRHVTLPLLSPAILFSLITGLIGSFQVFTQSFVMTGGGPGDSTLFYMLHLYNQAFVNLRMGYASALAWVLFAIIFGFVVWQFRNTKWVFYEGERS